ncbi:MAG: hypothetical protein ABIR11_06730 [Candidatus Limnocylindrales bacterium]
MQSIETTPTKPETKPNGPVAAALIAAGVASLVMGVLVVLNDVSPDISNFLKWDANFGLGKGVGALSGKAGMSIIAFIASWVILHLVLRGKDVRFARAMTVALVLVGLGFLLTFPPVFEIFVEMFKPAAA